jgi:UDPglucose 6-dehydrogenase
MVKICCIGSGYVGGPSMAVMALKCPAIEVAVVDVSRPRIDAWNSDRLPVLEPGLDAVIRECRGRNLFFSTDVDRHVADADIVFVSVNTPTKARGLGAGRAADLAYWESAARVGAAASRPGTSKIIAEKSAVPVRTAEAMERILLAHGGGKAAFQVLSNPEFFAEGTAVRDFLCPDRVLIGGRDTDAGRVAMRTLRDVYANWVPEDRIVSTGVCSAELAKLAANALLAQRVSSVNAMSALCEATGADVSDVTRAVGGDGRVGGAYLNAGVGFGGPSLQKDVLLLAYACEWHGLAEAAEYWRQVVAVNEYQKGRFVRRVVASMFGTVAGKKVAVLGFAFKGGVADARESPAADVCRGLLGDRAHVSVYDPAVGEKQIQRDTAAPAAKAGQQQQQVRVARDAYEAAEGAHGLCVLTEWDEFRALDYRRIFDAMQRPAFVFDGRGVVDVGKLREIGFVVYSVGKPLDPWLKGLPAAA